MSYDVTFFKLPPDKAVDLSRIGVEEEDGESSYSERLEPLGTAGEVAAAVKAIFPEADFEDFASYREGYLTTEDYAVTFYFPQTEAETDEMRLLALSLTGGEEAFAVVQMLHDRTGWRACDNDAEIDFERDPAGGMRYWTGTLETIRQNVGMNAGTPKKWWQFWK